MLHLPKMKEAVLIRPSGEYGMPELLRYRSYRTTYEKTPLSAKAAALKYVFENYPAHVYEYDRIAGSRYGTFIENPDMLELRRARDICGSYGSLGFWTNADHYAPGYERFLRDGIDGTMKRIEESLIRNGNDPDKKEFLEAQKLVLEGFAVYVRNYAAEAANMAERTENPDCRRELLQMAEDLTFISRSAPVTLRQALHLVTLIHFSFYFQNKYAMALGRMDQYLYPYFRHDMDAGILTAEEAEDLFACTFIKLTEARWTGGDDTVNICIGGVTPDGKEGINELSYIILHAVRDCNVPGPNLSARLHEGMPDRFLDECLQVIGTGLGYPALMNDRVNIPALTRHGYAMEDARNYCFVGCIENFIPGMQPAWSDGRFNIPQMLEAVFYRGPSKLDSHFLGLDTGSLDEMKTMADFMNAFEKQIAFAAGEYAAVFNNENGRYNYRNYAEPFMSLFCDDCIERGMDINCGGAVYPSVHGVGCMGIGTVTDSLAAVEKVVYQDRKCTLTELRDAMNVNFEGYETLQALLKSAPKYGNNDDFADKYAVWFVEYIDEVFSKYSTRDGGPFYTAIASNTQSVSAGHITGATPDGRKAGVPLSDAASPTYGADQNGPTSAFLSLCKPDYRLVSCGTVVNQKYTSDMLSDPVKRTALTAAIKAYFRLGGQEVQINCVSRETLKDAMAHPENYGSLVVRVSGFSAYFTSLARDVQEDILHRTEHSEI